MVQSVYDMRAQQTFTHGFEMEHLLSFDIYEEVPSISALIATEMLSIVDDTFGASSRYSVSFNFFVKWQINIHGLFKVKAILVEEQ